MKKNLLFVFLAFSLQDAFSQCAMFESATLNPVPVNNNYSAGTVVTMCYTIDSFAELQTNWFHGVILNFGPGWDTSTFTVISLPAGCDASGIWGYYNSDTSTGSGLIYGPGFYFDNSQGSPLLVLDGIPGNNYGDWGDDCIDASWTFCFSIQVDSLCSGGADLSVTATVTGDGTTGSWTNAGCEGTPFSIVSGVTCPGCNVAVTIDATNPLCFGEGGTATANATGGTSLSYLWSPGGDTTATITGLGPGTYTVFVSDISECNATASVTITEPPVLIADAGVDTTVCDGLYFPIGGNPTASGGTLPYHYSWTELGALDAANPVIETMATTLYHVIVTDSNECVQMDSVLITVIPCGVGIDDPVALNDLKVFPNPSHGIFTMISDKGILDAKCELIVYNLFGKEIWRQKILSKEQQLDLRNFSKGMYELVVKSDQDMMIRKMLETN